MSTQARVTALEQAMAELAQSQAYTNANLDRFNAEVRAASQAADKRCGELSNKMGTLAEDLVAPGIPAVFSTFFGLPDPQWRVRVWARHRTDRSRRREYDVVAWDGDVFLVNETKSQARPDDVTALLAAVAEAREYFVEAEVEGYSARWRPSSSTRPSFAPPSAKACWSSASVVVCSRH